MKRFLILVIVALSMLVSADARDIGYNMTINESGTYALSENMLVNYGGIRINASNVVLDGQNHQIICNNSEGTGIYVGTYEDTIENITIKNVKIKNWPTGSYIRWNVKNITVINCEFENNTYFLYSEAVEQYFYLNTIHENQNAETEAPLASPKLVYTYSGNEYTYRLGNYYEGYTGAENEDEGVFKGAYEIDDGSAYDPYPLIKTPENYKIIETLYPEVESEYEEDGALIGDIFALDSKSKNYVITDAPVTPNTPSSTSNGGGGRSYDSDISDEIESKVIKNFVSSATVLFGNGIDEQYAIQLRERVTDANGFTISGNAVIVGGPKANPFAREYNEQFEMPISNDNPGENRGIIQVMTVQDNSGTIIRSYTIVYIAGSDRLGTQAALEYFKTLDELPEGPLMVEWTENGPVVVE
ncbi:hypothetical protein HNP89_001247 [Methanococcus maripaludis]|uniref:S-layer protein C-terminal domain-containing protein n=1 Tax=Methanococcus maripaludis TaxID=39152 RepID=A0A7J9P014_METMI|nr:hypothetical protein [Methanococcus maripaludis]MBA2853290.1 hypothetical protein [Methanococcus maripaludis]